MSATSSSADALAEAIERRAQSWAASCRSNTYRGMTPRETFERALEDMRSSPYRLPPALIARVRELLPHPEQEAAREAG